MTVARVVLTLTCVAVAGLAGWFAVARWEDANRVATATSAVFAVAAVGVAVWVALRTPGTSVRVKDTGRATSTGSGTANTGVMGPAQGNVVVERTGEATSGGAANSGVRFD
ncbi:hypothetical protein [Lentzea terrae]|uniref:hypothetical protein n=1 Tax=Lentzea terrae TaxID=2200761 RepID=UPI0018E4EE49|nr:hypothetical protein [Lentzea terrae]